ncbi:hypothetical protein K2W90_00535 [Candidatus Babeliales bacterium]|nr:hypothetical protein [Candidatus Babeliales bacterium]
MKAGITVRSVLGWLLVLAVLIATTVGSVQAGLGYYEPANLKALKAAGAELHSPLLMLIDEQALQSQSKEYPTGAVGNVTWNLTASLQLGFYPIVVTTSILYNFLTRKYQGKNKKNMRGAALNQSEWSMYDVVGTPLFLLVPRVYKNIYGFDHFKSENFRDLTKLLPQRGNDYRALLTQIAGFQVDMSHREPFRGAMPRKAAIPYNGTELATIFQNNPLYVFDVLIHGHGNFKRGGTICGMTIDATRTTLDLLTTHFKAGVVMLRTCSAGGRHVGIIEMDELNVRPDHDYILISNAVTDAPIGTTYEMSLQWNPKIFDRAARVDYGKAALNALLKGVVAIEPRPFSVHNISMYPQVWLPGSAAFQTEEIDNDVNVLDNNEARIMTQTGLPFVANQQAILFYPPVLQVPLVVNAKPYDAEQAGWSKKNHYWQNLPTLLEFLVENKDVLSVVASNPGAFPRLSALQQAGDLAPPLSRNLYPTIVSMVRGEGTHYLKRFEVQALRKANGVLHAIRDGFFDVARRQSVKTFAIDQVVGNNDITAMLEAVRASQGVESPHPLEVALGAGEQVTLRNVLIASQAYKNEQREWKQWVSLKFEVNGTAWAFRWDGLEMGGADVARPWNFAPLDVAALNNAFNSAQQSVGARLHREMGVQPIVEPSVPGAAAPVAQVPGPIAPIIPGPIAPVVEEAVEPVAVSVEEPVRSLPVYHPIAEPVVSVVSPPAPVSAQSLNDQLLAVVSAPGRQGMQRVQALLAAGADPNYPGVLAAAVRTGKKQIAKLLREKGAR